MVEGNELKTVGPATEIACRANSVRTRNDGKKTICAKGYILQSRYLTLQVIHIHIHKMYLIQ